MITITITVNEDDAKEVMDLIDATLRADQFVGPFRKKMMPEARLSLERFAEAIAEEL